MVLSAPTLRIDRKIQLLGETSAKSVEDYKAFTRLIDFSRVTTIQLLNSQEETSRGVDSSNVIDRLVSNACNLLDRTELTLR